MPVKLKTISAVFILIFVMISLSVATDKPESEEPKAVSVEFITQDSIYKIINSDYQQVKQLFANSCFDCHSDQTKFPWYHSWKSCR